MPKDLKVSVGQHSSKGRKEINQDFHAVCTPHGSQLNSKGIAVALADGISSSRVSQVASQAAVTGFLEDYYCTSDAWSVKQSAHKVLMATNSWLHSQTQQSQYRYDKDKGYVCTFSALIVKSTTAHIFHVGDTRIYRLQGNALEQLTNDHRLWITEGKSYLSRALGIDGQLEIDYQAMPVDIGEIFVLATDGVYEHCHARFIADVINAHEGSLDLAAQAIVEHAYQNGSDDNLTVQIVRIDDLPSPNADELYQQLTELPFPPMLEAPVVFDGYQILREVHASSRSHVYLAQDIESGNAVIVKTPSIDLRGDPAYLERFLMEEWVARRINSPQVVRAAAPARPRHYIYSVTEYVEGQTLSQWMIDNPRPDLQTVRAIVEQIAKGLRAFHRLEMLHQDLRPANVMIDRFGTIKIIDFGSTRVAGIVDSASALERNPILGTAQFTAPEYFLGEGGSPRSDLFSLGVITYQMLTGHLPYGTQVSKSRTRAAQHKLKYRSVQDFNPNLPLWLDGVLKKAVHPNPLKRHDDLSELVYELRYPEKAPFHNAHTSLAERNPVRFWQCVSLLLTIAVVVLLLREVPL